MRPTSTFSENGLVTSRSAEAAASCAASLATRVLRCTCTARYQSEATTANELISCAVALTASQFISTQLYRRSAICSTARGAQLLSYLKHNLTAGVSRSHLLLRLSSLGQRPYNRHHWLDLVALNQSS